MKRLSLNAPAKINLGLNIVSKRPDGFHNLETFFYPLYDLHDELIFERNDNFIFDSNNSRLIKDPDNLVLKAHTIIENRCNKRLPIKISLIKNIPIGAGLGGGSSDAAATLLGLNEFFELGIKTEELSELALDLGSDVPFFIRSKPSVGYSRGEVLQQSSLYIENPILIINPGIHISTKEAFSNISPEKSQFNYEYFLKSADLNFKFLSENLRNDFEDYIFLEYEEIKKIKSAMLSSGAIYAQMSGTGSTVFGIFNNMNDAEELCESMPDDYFKFISV